MGQGSQIAGSAKRTLGIYHGQNVVVVKIDQTLHRLQLNSGMAITQGLNLEQQHQFDNLSRHFVSRSACMRLDQIFLKFRKIVFGNFHVAKRAKTGIDAINGFRFRSHFLVEIIPAFLNIDLGLVRQCQQFMLQNNFLQALQGKNFGTYIMSVVHLFSRF